MKLRNTVKSAATVLGVLVLGLATSANAATAVTTTFTVSAQVNAICTISAGNLNFGTYTGVVNNNTSTITVQCSNTTPYNVGLSAGSAPGATVTTRQMMVNGAGAGVLSYSLFSDTNRSKNWGQTIGTDTVTGTGTGAAQTLTVYGQIPAGTIPAPNAYSDTVTATITY